MRSFFHKSIVLLLLGGLMVSCADSSRPNYQYMSDTDMYEPVGYESYGEYPIFPQGQSAMEPAEGSVARGKKPYDYDNTPDGSSQAKSDLKNPLLYTEENLAEGKQLYTIYCAVCHSDSGDGQGILAEREKILGVPSYDDVGRAITEGSVYHVIYYGLNSMGSYASQLNEKERWQVTHYVMNLKDQLEGNEEREFEEVGATASPDDPEVQAAQDNVGEGTVLTEEESNN